MDRWRLLGVVTLSVVGIALSGCDNSSTQRESIKSSILGLRDALARGSGDGACDQLTVQAKERIVADAAKGDPKYGTRSCTDVMNDALGSIPGGIKTLVHYFGSIEAKTVVIDGNRATATTNKGGSLTLRKVGYRWLIDTPPAPLTTPAARRCRKGIISFGRRTTHDRNGRDVSCA